MTLLSALSMPTIQRLRRATQVGFFVLFLLAPALNLLRFDLSEAQLWFLGVRWTLGIDALRAGEIDATQAGLNLVLRALLPLVVLAGSFLWVAYRYGRLYCGWLCPHFSMVESLNNLLHRACGKLSVWDAVPVVRAGVQPHRGWWPLFAVSCLVAAFTWAITLLTYLLPPTVIWGGLLTGTLTPNQTRFLVVGTAVFFLEFALARHLFCRFGCAVGLFQSLAWMANPRSLVVAFDRGQARDCKTCQSELPQQNGTGNACDSQCPMRLKPRNIKRRMFSVNARRSHIDEYGVWGEDCVHRNVNPQWSRRWNTPQTTQAARHRSGANTAQSSRPAWSNNAANPATPQRRWPSTTASTSAWYAAGLS